MDSELIAGGDCALCSERMVHESRYCPDFVDDNNVEWESREREHTPLRGISSGSANNAGPPSDLGAKCPFLTGFGRGCCHGVGWAVWDVESCSAAVESGVLTRLCEAGRSKRFILEKLFFSDDIPEGLDADD